MPELSSIYRPLKPWSNQHAMKPTSRRCYITLSIAIVALSACSRSETNWAEAQKQATLEAYSNFLADFPESSHKKEAAQRIEELRWASAVSTRSEIQLSNCIESYPNSTNIARAKHLLKELEDRAWNAALLANTKEDYIGFKKAHPSSERVMTAQGMLFGQVESRVVPNNNGLNYVKTFFHLRSVNTNSSVTLPLINVLVPSTKCFPQASDGVVRYSSEDTYVYSNAVAVAVRRVEGSEWELIALEHDGVTKK